MFSTDQIAYKILHKVANHHEKQPTVKLIFIETQSEIKLSDLTYRMYIKDLEGQGYLKIWGENKDDWGQIIISPTGIEFVEKYPTSGNAERDYELLSQYLDSLIKKNTKDLIQAKRSAELHLAKLTEMMEFQRGLATSGKPNSYSHCVRQKDTAELELHKINEELEVRKTLAMETSVSIGNKSNATQEIPKPLTDEDRRIKMFESHVGNQTFYPTFEKYLQHLVIKKGSKKNWEYLDYLLEEQIKYGNANHYYTLWGERGTGVNRGPLYTQILKLIEAELTDGLKEEKDNPQTNEKPTQQNRFKLSDYALMQFYLFSSGEGESVTNTNKDNIASKYGYKGHKFYLEYNKNTSINNRTGLTTERSDAIKKARFEKVIELLSDFPKALERATDEQKMFLSAYQKQY